MHQPDNEGAIDRKLEALFAAAGEPPEGNAQFVQEVLRRIRRRQRARWLILGGSGLIATVFAAPVIWEFSSAWGGIELTVLEEFRAALKQIAISATALLRSAVTSITFLAAAALAATIVPLLRWLAD